MSKPGDKIKEFIDRTLDCRDCGRALEIPEKGICCTDCGKNFRWNDELKQDFDQLIESHKENVELKERVEELEKENNCYKQDIKNLINERDRMIKQRDDAYASLEKENQQLKKYAEIGKAFVYSMNQQEFTFGIGTKDSKPMVRILDGNIYRFVSLVEWYRKEVNNV